MKKNELFLDVGDGKKVKTVLVEMNISELSFYPDNPRVGSLLLNHSGTINNEIIHKKMWDKQGEATRSLYQAIKKAKNVNEPLIVYKNQTIEGNTRLCVLRELFKDTNEKRWNTVNCRVIEEELTEIQLNYVIYHVQMADKKKDWEPFEQACYFNKMSIQNRSIQEIKDITGCNESLIRDYIRAYSEMQKRCIKSEEFSLIYETIKQKEVKQEINKGTDIISIVIKKHSEGKIKDARDPRKLKQIFASDKAKEMFLHGDGDIDHALKIACYTNPEVKDEFLNDMKSFTGTLSLIPYDKLIEIKKDKKKIEIVEAFYNKVLTFYKQIKQGQ